MQRTLGIFAKQPVPGRVKTRLAAETSPEWAAEVARAFLLDTLDVVQTISVRRVVVHEPPDAAPYFQHITGELFELVPQVAGDLGQRMLSFLRQSFASGSRATVLIGTDSPTLPAHFIVQAFAELAQADVVLGPATDGGYYLMGCARQIPPIFEGIEWGTSRVLEQTVAAVERLRLRLALLPPWYDVDTLDNWRMLKGHAAALRLAGMEPRAPMTRKLLG